MTRSGVANLQSDRVALHLLPVGERGPMPGWVGEEMAGVVPGAEPVTVPGAGQRVWHEQPGSVSRALARLAALT